VRDDQTVAVVPLDDVQADCLRCRTIEISSTGAGFLLLPSFFGNFSVMGGVYMDGKPVYRNSAGRFLHLDSFTTFGIRGDFSGDGASVQSASGPLCPFLKSASTSLRLGDGWKFWTGNDWEVDSTIKTVCQDRL